MSRFVSNSLGIVVTLFGMLLASPTEAGCSIHDQDCRFHGIGRAINDTVKPDDPTAVYIVTEALSSSSSGSGPVDYDNNLLLPDGVGPYIVSSTGFLPTGDRNEPYIEPDEQDRHVYPSLPQIDFQYGTAQASHSGDNNGGEVGGGGCTMSGTSDCEEVVLRGNLPYIPNEGAFVVKQTNHLYNFHEVPDPEVELRSYGIATGRAYFLNKNHLSVDVETLTEDDQKFPGDDSRRNLEQTKSVIQNLSGTGDVGEELTYYIGVYDFDPHAGGVVHHHDQKRTVNSEYLQGWNYYASQMENGIYQYKVDQYRYTIEKYNKTYAFIEQENNTPILEQSEVVTDSYYIHSNPFNFRETQDFINYKADLRRKEEEHLARIQKQLEEDQAAGCNYSGCSNDQKNVWPGARNPKTPLPSPNIDHPFSDNLYYTQGNDGKLYLHNKKDGKFSWSDIWYGVEVIGEAGNYYWDNKGEITRESIDTVAAAPISVYETTVQGVTHDIWETRKIIPGGESPNYDFEPFQELKLNYQTRKEDGAVVIVTDYAPGIGDIKGIYQGCFDGFNTQECAANTAAIIPGADGFKSMTRGTKNAPTNPNKFDNTSKKNIIDPNAKKTVLETTSGKSYGKLGKVVEPPDISVSGVRGHYVEQKINRGVATADVINTLKHPEVVLEQSNGYLYISGNAAVVINKQGHLVTTYGKSNFSPEIWSILNKVK